MLPDSVSLLKAGNPKRKRKAGGLRFRQGDRRAHSGRHKNKGGAHKMAQPTKEPVPSLGPS